MEFQVVPPGGDKNTGPIREAVGGVILSIAFVLVSLRFYVRSRIVKKRLWWDDFFLLLGLLFSIAVFGLVIAGINSGIGRHVYYLSPKQKTFAMKLQKIISILAIFSLMFTKISICLFLLRIFTTNRVWKKAMYIILALVMATSLSSAIAMLPQCNPVAKSWNPTIKGTCWSKGTQLAISYYQGGFSIFTDFLLAILPIYFLKDIQISFRTKVSICILMSLGVFTGICAINRTASTAPLYSSDITYSGTNLYIWIGLEINVAIIAAAIPALRPLWAKSANQNQIGGHQVRWPNNRQRLNSTYAIRISRWEPTHFPLASEIRITTLGSQNQGTSEAKSGPLPDCNQQS